MLKLYFWIKEGCAVPGSQHTKHQSVGCSADTRLCDRHIDFKLWPVVPRTERLAPELCHAENFGLCLALPV